MLWFKKQPVAALPAATDQIGPAELPVALDRELFKLYFTRMLATVEQDGGIEAYLASLGAKHHAYAELLERSRIERLTLADLELLLGRVFTARRRVFPALKSLGATRAAGLVGELLHGTAPLGQRIQSLVDAMPGAEGMGRDRINAAAKVRRAAWDFAAELMHFSDPVKYPLMSRWVWDQSTQSGALREFIRGADAMGEIPFNNTPELFEGGRRWLAEQIAEQGIYRDIHFWIDLVLAEAYTTYFRSVTEGSLGADFGRGGPPYEQLRKLLGIDMPRSEGHSRVKKAGHEALGARRQ